MQLIENEAVFFSNKEDGNTFNAFSFDIQKSINNIQPDAYFVFNKQPIILFFDFTNENEKTENDRRDEAEIHKKVWSFDISPVIFMLKNDEIRVYNALNYENGLVEILLKDNEKIEKFSFWNLHSGETLEWFYNKYKKTLHKKRVHQQLFENIKQAILLLKDHCHLDEKVAKLLVLRLIFCRYLIDRKIKIDKKYINEVENEVINRRRLFGELIANPKKLQDFFIYLNERFNGVLFHKDSLVEITQEQSDILSKLFNPDGVSISEKRNLFLDFDFQFEVFDFGIIPVELISGIYETLLDEETKNSTSAVYTPPFLVDYILNKTVDKYFEKNENSSECKLFDPAMGSGIFLVQGLRRMIEQEKKLNPDADNNAFGKRIKEIAENNLFGIDINEEAINVACFSIYVALLDYQEPGNIDVYKFPTLRDTNFFRTNFFTRNIIDSDPETTKNELTLFSKNLEYINSQKIDFILGNPPWKRDNKDYHIGWLNENNIYPKSEKGEKEIALSYLMRVNDFMSENTICSLIVTSTIFYNVADTTRYVKNKFYQNYSIQSVLDLSPVRKLVFEGKKSIPKKDKNKKIQYDKNGNIIYENKPIISPAVVIQFQKYNQEFSEQNPIYFTSIKQNKFFNKFSKALVIEKFDQKEILQKHFIENDWMFKVALYGNTLDFALLKRLEENKSKILDQIDGANVFKGAGIERGENPKPYSELLGMPIVENKTMNEFYISNSFNSLLTEKDIYLSRGRDKNIFLNNKILFRENNKNESNLWLSYSESNFVFRKGFFSISSNNSDLIKILYSLLNSDLVTYLLFNISCAWGVATRPAIRFDDELLQFPYIEPSESQKKQLINLVDKLLKPYKIFYKEYPDGKYIGEPNLNVLAEINSIIEEIYQIKPYEKDLINYVLEVSRYQFQESKQERVTSFNLFGRNKEQILKEYAEVYLQEFGKIYDDEFMQVEIYQLDYFIAMNFVLKEVKPKETIVFIKEKTNEQQVLNKLASNLSISQITNTNDAEHNLFIQKDIKGFENNSFYIIKPNEYKCWHRAMAWYDVGEFREAIEDAEIEHFNNESL